MMTCVNVSCGRCSAIHPRNGEIENHRIHIPYNLVDHYPGFPILTQSASTGCALCGLLLQVLQQKYSEKGLADAEDDFREAYRQTWPAVNLERKVEINGATFCTEGDWVFREREDLSKAEIDSLEGVYRLKLEFSPYPPRRPERAKASLYFSTYADFGG